MTLPGTGVTQEVRYVDSTLICLRRGLYQTRVQLNV
jgi:hypothetical protein